MSTPPKLVGKLPAPSAPKLSVPAGRPRTPAVPAAPKPPTRVAKLFTVAPYSGGGEGKKIVVYATSGMGKTTLASMAPRPVFFPLDDGVREIRDPRDGSVLNAIRGIEDYQDLRDAIRTPSLFDAADTAVLDTVTMAESMSDQYVFDNYPKENREKASGSIESYGYGKGYRHSLEVMRLLLSDLDLLIRQGKNVVLLAQESTAALANAEGLDYLVAGPKLNHNKQFSNRLEVQEWADHLLRISYPETRVAGADKATKGKIISTDTSRVIFTAPARHFAAKARLVNGVRLPPVISFSANEEGNPDDDSLWRFMFPEKYPEG